MIGPAVPKTFDFGSFFSGIGALDLGLMRAGMSLSFQCEINTEACRVLQARFPSTFNHGDITNVKEDQLPSTRLIAAGFPCQDLSVAGPRTGLAGPRSGLFWELHRIIKACRPDWLVLENVPGLLSSNNGRDFGTILASLDDLGYCTAWRVLYAPDFGLPQKRKRLFLVCSLGRDAAAKVLFDQTGMLYDYAPGEEDRQDDPFTFGRCAHPDPYAIAAYTIQRNDSGKSKRKDRPNGGLYITETDKSLTVGSPNQVVIVENCEDLSSYLVRDLSINELERLQGLPTDWTSPSPITYRRQQLANAVPTAIAQWIGSRILQYDNEIPS